MACWACQVRNGPATRAGGGIEVLVAAWTSPLDGPEGPPGNAVAVFRFAVARREWSQATPRTTLRPIARPGTGVPSVRISADRTLRA